MNITGLDRKVKLIANNENLDNKVKRRCPATMLAISRTAKVNGRIIFLMVSIKTMKDINATGVPDGVMCAKKDLKLFEIAKKTLSIQITIVKVKFRDMWEVTEITWGNNEKKLHTITNVKIITGILEIIKFFIFFIEFVMSFLSSDENWDSNSNVINEKIE